MPIECSRGSLEGKKNNNNTLTVTQNKRIITIKFENAITDYQRKGRMVRKIIESRQMETIAT